MAPQAARWPVRQTTGSHLKNQRFHSGSDWTYRIDRRIPTERNSCYERRPGAGAATPDVRGTAMNASAFVSVVAGLGLFIIGIKGIAGNMGQLAGRSVRDWLARSTDNYFSSVMVGMITGALTQSTNAVTVILMSLFKADLITVPQARPGAGLGQCRGPWRWCSPRPSTRICSCS